MKGEEFEIPFILNLDKKSPISVCFDIKQYKNVEFFLKTLKNCSLDHHTRVMLDCIPEAIKLGFQEIGPYMDSRFLQTSKIKAIKRGFLKETENLDYACTTGKFWEDDQSI